MIKQNKLSDWTAVSALNTRPQSYYIYVYSLLLKFDFKSLKQLFHKAFKKALTIS